MYWRTFGNITDATLMMDKESGRHRGFGFVNYEHVESVERVLAEGPHMMEGQTVSNFIYLLSIHFFTSRLGY